MWFFTLKPCFPSLHTQFPLINFPLTQLHSPSSSITNLHFHLANKINNIMFLTPNLPYSLDLQIFFHFVHAIFPSIASYTTKECYLMEVFFFRFAEIFTLHKIISEGFSQTMCEGFSQPLVSNSIYGDFYTESKNFLYY